jgi:Na+-driven multidrug efflux pump
MPAPLWIERLRQRWKVESIWQVVIILIVFACTGFSVYFLKKPILKLFTGDQHDTVLVKILYYILILPLYNLLLLGYGFIFGQFDFFWAFEKKFFGRIGSWFKRK